jgi:cyclohexanone monooxygenase
LVDVRDDPIERITPSGVQTSRESYDVDVLIFATGYDAVTGGLTRVNIVGEGAVTMKEKFASGHKTYLGLLTTEFPNFFTVVLNAGGTFVPTMEPIVDWVVELLDYMRTKNLGRVVPTAQAERDWVRLVEEEGEKVLRTKGSHWAVGANIPGKARTPLLHPLSSIAMRERLASEAAHGYEGLDLT